MRHFGETQSKTMKAYVQSRQYHTIVESHVHLTIIITTIQGPRELIFIYASQLKTIFHMFLTKNELNSNIEK